MEYIESNEVDNSGTDGRRIFFRAFEKSIVASPKNESETLK
jgi:hypothetical protein